MKRVVVLSAQTTVQAAAAQMASLDVDLLPVGTVRGLIGVLRARDIAHRCVASGRRPSEMSVEEAMTLGVPAVSADASVPDALERMRRVRSTSLVVLNGDRQPVGILSMASLQRQLETH